MRNQILHIFRKDVRHHAAEIFLSLVVLAAYAWHETTRLNPLNSSSTALEVLLPLLSALLSVVWVFLIIRVMHEEPLVGDRQFWVTRPYEWRKLLAAKVLFIVVFVNLPLISVQVFLLIVAGFPLTPHISGLLWLHLLWVVFVILPAVTLAAVTATTGQFLLVVLGAVLYLILMFSVASHIPGEKVAGANSLPSQVALWIYIGVSVTAVLWQYARRRTMTCWNLVLGAAAVIAILFAATPYRTAINHLYRRPTAGQQLPVTMAFDPAKPASPGRGYPEKNKVHVRIPLFVSGIASGSEISVGGKMLDIQAAGGQRWSSGWNGSGEHFLPDIHNDETILAIDKDFFERVKSIPVNLRITFALFSWHAREVTRIVTQPNGFGLPGEGRCSFSPFELEASGASCVFPAQSPYPRMPYLLIAVKSEEMTCPKRENETSPPAGTTFYGRTWGAPFFGISPIQDLPIFFWSPGKATDRDHRPHICPGTPLTVFANWEELPAVREELEIDGIRLSEYQLNDSAGGTYGFGVVVP